MSSNRSSAFPRRVLAKSLYDGRSEEPFRDQLIDIATSDGASRINTVRPLASIEELDSQTLVADIVAPGMIDLQINGALDTQFNFEPSVDAIARIAEGARRGGTAHLLPTFITAPGRDYLLAMEAGRQAIEIGLKGVLGVHLEGPFLSPSFPGIHEKAAIRSLQAEDLANLIAPFAGKLLLTLAPEEQQPDMLRALADAGVVVFAGHSAARGADIQIARQNGISGATHLFNAMSQMTAREPGLVGSVFDGRGLYAGIIADGYHVCWPNLRTTARLLPDHLCLVTDAMLTLEGKQTAFELHGERIELGDGRLTNHEGRLAGAHISMDQCVRNVVEFAGVSTGRALMMASANPAAALGLDSELGRIAPGYRASMTLFNSDLSVEGVVVDGQYFHINSGLPS